MGVKIIIILVHILPLAMQIVALHTAIPVIQEVAAAAHVLVNARVTQQQVVVSQSDSSKYSKVPDLFRLALLKTSNKSYANTELECCSVFYQ